MKQKYLFLFLLVFLVSGCASKQRSIYLLVPAIKDAGKYFSILKKNTKGKRLINMLDIKGHLNVTYNSWDLKKAYLKELSLRKNLTPDEQKELFAKVKADNEKYLSFIFILFTHKESENDLNNSNSIWNIFIANEKGNIIKPEKIEKLDIEDPAKIYFYPHMNLWAEMYEVKFLKKGFWYEDLTWLKILFAGIPSKTELLWAL